MSTFMVVDGNNALMKAIHATHYARQDDDPVREAGATLDRFVGMLGRRVREDRPERLVVAWDDTTSWRKAVWEGYKAQREQAVDPDAKGSAFALAKLFCHACGIPNAAAPGMEADDIVAAFWRGADPRRVDLFLIVSDDRDYAQLLGTTAHGIRCEQVGPSDDTGDRWTTERVWGKWGCTPEQVPMVKALMGDSSDNIPGLRGVGPKKALARLKAHGWDLNAAVADRDVTERDDVATFLALVDLRTKGPTYPTPPRWVPRYTDEALTPEMSELLTHYQLARIRSQLLSGELWSPRQDYVPEVHSLLPQGADQR